MENSLKITKELHAVIVEKLNTEIRDANDRASLAMQAASGLQAQAAAKDKMIADQDAMLIKAANAHIKMMHDFEDFRSNCKIAMEGKDECINKLKALLKTSQDDVENKKRVDGASVVKIVEHIRVMFAGLNDVLNNNNCGVEIVKIKKPTQQEGGGEMKYTPEQSINMAKAKLFTELLISDAKLREDFSGEWTSLVNSCVAKARNIDFRRVECGIVAICSLFIKKMDPTYVANPACASFGATVDQVSERFTEMIGSEQSSGRFMRSIIEETLTRMTTASAGTVV